MGYKTKILLLTTILLSILTLLPNYRSYIKAETIHFEDNFNDNDVNDWSTSSDPSTYCSPSSIWKTRNFGDENYAYGIRIEDHGCRIFTKSPAELVDAEQDFIFEIDLLIPTLNNDVNVIFKFKDSSNLMGFYSINNIHNLYKLVNGNYHFLGSYNYTLTPNTWHHFKITKLGMKHDFFIDDNYSGSYIESPPYIDSFGVGFRMGNGSNPFSEAWFDNVKVTLLPTNTLFDLPIYYENRDIGNFGNFKSTFWNKLTASFDHERKGKFHIPFTGEEYKSNDCKRGYVGIECYNGHKGTDFDDDNSTNDTSLDNVFPAADGDVVYVSKYKETHDGEKCVEEKGGYGCVMIIKHETNDQGILYTLYAHLKDIKSEYRDVTPDTPENVIFTNHIAEMGNTGCGGCGTHLHFGVMKELPSTENNSIKKMSENDWQGLLEEANIAQQQSSSPKHYCTYNAPNGMRFAFLDPSGWNPEDKNDPWFESCGVESSYLWKHDVGSPPNENDQLNNFLEPLESFIDNL